MLMLYEKVSAQSSAEAEKKQNTVKHPSDDLDRREWAFFELLISCWNSKILISNATAAAAATAARLDHFPSPFHSLCFANKKTNFGNNANSNTAIQLKVLRGNKASLIIKPTVISGNSNCNYRIIEKKIKRKRRHRERKRGRENEKTQSNCWHWKLRFKKNERMKKKQTFIKLFKCDSFAFLSGCVNAQKLGFLLNSNCTRVVYSFCSCLSLIYDFGMPCWAGLSAVPCRAFCIVSCRFTIASFRTAFYQYM